MYVIGCYVKFWGKKELIYFSFYDFNWDLIFNSCLRIVYKIYCVICCVVLSFLDF